MVADNFPLEYGGFILLFIPVFQLRALGTRTTAGLTVKDRGKEPLGTSSFVTVSFHSQQSLEFLLSPAFVADAFIEAFSVVFYGVFRVVCFLAVIRANLSNLQTEED